MIVGQIELALCCDLVRTLRITFAEHTASESIFGYLEKWRRDICRDNWRHTNIIDGEC